MGLDTVCPRSSDQFYIVTYYMKWVTTSWTDGICHETHHKHKPVKSDLDLKISVLQYVRSVQEVVTHFIYQVTK